MGTFIGARVRTEAGTTLVFPRSDDWQVAQSFPDARSAAMRTVFTKAGAPFEITVDDHVALDADVWVRRVTVTPTAGVTINTGALSALATSAGAV